MLRKPKWLRTSLGHYKNLNTVETTLEGLALNTVCDAANCPNRSECFSKKTATFMILGNHCSRNCRFCDVVDGDLSEVDIDEPVRIAKAVKKLGLKYVVITSVTRDDLEDGGASQFASVIEAVRESNPDVMIEVLIPDFQGNKRALDLVIQAEPEIINHNMETIKRLYKDIRPQAIYERSLEVLEYIKDKSKTIQTKSGLMVGLGEKSDEIHQVMKDLRSVDCDYLTIGQYLQPSKDHYPVKEYVHPDMFRAYEKYGLDLGFESVASGPLIRSSYNAYEMYNQE